MTIASFTYKMFSVTAEGFAMDEDVPVDLMGDGYFKIELPHYVATIVGQQDVIGYMLQAAIDAYAAACEQYQRARLKGGKKVLLVDVSANYDMVNADVAISVMHDTEIEGRLLRYEAMRQHMIVLPYSPETEAKLVAIRESMRIAGELLEGFSKTADPVKYLHEIQFGQPVSAEVAQFHGDWKPEELPVVGPTDDEVIMPVFSEDDEL